MGAGTAVILLLVNALAGSQTKEEITRAKILAAGPEWQQKYDLYEPDAEMIGALKAKVGADVKVDVYLGLWCPDSRNNVPQFIKILDRLGVALPVRYFDLPRKSGKDVRYFIDELKVEKVPTFIFYRGDQEIGRIVENPETGMLEDFMDIMFR